MAILLSAWALALHWTFFYSAGALWRDEASSLEQANLPTGSDFFTSLQWDSFPVLYPLLLRLWSSVAPGSSDLSLRLSGLLTGICLLAAVWVVARILGGDTPAVSLVLFGTSPIVISECDSLRPHGLSVTLMLGAFASMGAYLRTPGVARLCVATLLAVLAVQSSYMNAVLLAACTLAAACTAWRHLTGGETAPLLIPGAAAAVSLLPYQETLESIGRWSSIPRIGCDWNVLWQELTQAYGWSLSVHGVGAVVLAALAFSAMRGGNLRADENSEAREAAAFYSILTGVLAVAAQVLFLELAGIRPFSRYFLPCLAILGIAMDLSLRNRAGRLTGVTIMLMWGATLWPAWTWTRTLSTNMDLAGMALSRLAGPGDVVLVSPWFLSPGFRRYYHGKADWLTVPSLPDTKMTRYDLIAQAMLDDESTVRTRRLVEGVAGHGGAIWQLSQRPPDLSVADAAPARPLAGHPPTGTDYARFRSYWEKGVEQLLVGCCLPENVDLSEPRRVRPEEKLVLTRWLKKD